MKLNPGDIVEIETGDGLAYVQVTHNHPSYPEVVRVLPGFHDSRPDGFDVLARAKSVFTTMLPLGGAIKGKRMTGTRVGSTAIPDEHKDFPTFRMPIRDRRGGVAYWWFWDGEGLRYDTELDEKSAGFPMREVMSVSTFIEKLASLQMEPDPE